ncbi:hypothetical protein H0H92_003072 [Tricholoma furcatifolium]|nr:hypothetical protein H0H92_003072 [Tricholoma furcatifolium]
MELATSTLATCLDDIVSLIQKLKRTVDKIPQNRRNARKLSDELLAGALDIENYHNAHKASLQGSPELLEELSKFLQKLNAVHARCIQLFTPSRQKGLWKLGSTFKAWMECDKVEEEIAELKDMVHSYYRRLTGLQMMALARIEDPANTVYNITNKTEETDAYLNENKTLILGQMECLLTTLRNEESKGQSVLIQSLKNEVNTLYLHYQVEIISASLANLSVSRAFTKEMLDYPLPSETTLNFRSPLHGLSEEDFHREVVAKALGIIRLLKGDLAVFTNCDGAQQLVDLAFCLCKLNMYSDAVIVGTWTVAIYRELAITNPALYEPLLGMSLRLLTRYKYHVNDQEGSATAIHESVEILRRVTQESPSLVNRIDLCVALCEYWYTMSDKGRAEESLEIAMEAMGVVDAIRAEFRAWDTWFKSPPSSTWDPPPYVEVEKDLTGISYIPPLDIDGWLWLQYSTGSALSCLAFSLEDNGNADQAYQPQLKSLAIWQDLSQNHSDRFCFDGQIAKSCSHLASAALRKGRPHKESLDYAERALGICRSMPKYAPWLPDTLWDYAFILDEGGRSTDVTRVTQEALKIIRDISKDQKSLAHALCDSASNLRQLKHDSTAVSIRTEALSIYRTLITNGSSAPTGSVETIDPVLVPETLMSLAGDLMAAKKAADATTTCKEAISLFRAILKQTPTANASLDLAHALSYLSRCLILSKDTDTALDAADEAITIYRNQFCTIGLPKGDVQDYVTALRRASYSSSIHVKNPKALATSAGVVEDLQMLAVDHKDEVGRTLVNAFLDRGFLLRRHERAREACCVTEEMLQSFKIFPVTDASIAVDYMTAAQQHADDLFDVGRYKDALLTCEKAVDIGISFSRADGTKALECALAGVRETQASCLWNAGRYAESEAVMKLSLDATRVHLEPESDTTLACRCRRYAAILSQMPERVNDALKQSEEAVALCRSAGTSAPYAEAHLPCVMDIYATCVANSGDDLRALGIIKEAIERYRELRQTPYRPLDVPWVFLQPSYADALVLFASCLMAIGDYEAAHKELIEAYTIIQDLVIERPCLFVILLRCLDMLSVSLHILGLYEEENKALKDLDDRQREMEVLNAEVAMSGRIGLRELRASLFVVRLRARVYH